MGGLDCWMTNATHPAELKIPSIDRRPRRNAGEEEDGDGLQTEFNAGIVLRTALEVDADGHVCRD